MVRIDNLNPFVVNRDTPQKISWKHFKLKTKYTFELLLPLKAITVEYNGKGSYLRLCARVVKDQSLEVSEILENQLVIIDVPIKTFDRAWSGINYIFRHNLTIQDNVQITFRKLTRESIELVTYEKLQSTTEQVAFCTEYYIKPEPFQKTVVKENEEL